MSPKKSTMKIDVERERLMEKEKEREKGRRKWKVKRSYRTASPPTRHVGSRVNFQSYAMPLGRSDHMNKKERKKRYQTK